MKAFLDDDFLLNGETAKRLYHHYAKDLPIIDYHSHLPPGQIANDINFNNLTQAWLYGDHYKWRAMRANGVNEKYVTGNASDEEKFLKWAETVPYTLRNPLYHWTHLELRRYFGVAQLLSPKTAKEVYDGCSATLQTPEYSIKNLLAKMKVEVVCTTDDPLDNLGYHQQIKQAGFSVKVLPTVRPDKAMNVDDTLILNEYIDKLEGISGVIIQDIDTYLDALKIRHDYFAANGCKLSDHGLEHIYAENYSEQEIDAIFKKIRRNYTLMPLEIAKFKSAMLFNFALWDHEKGWVQQYHLGALRNNNTRAPGNNIGPDTGWDVHRRF